MRTPEGGEGEAASAAGLQARRAVDPQGGRRCARQSRPGPRGNGGVVWENAGCGDVASAARSPPGAMRLSVSGADSPSKLWGLSEQLKHACVHGRTDRRTDRRQAQ